MTTDPLTEVGERLLAEVAEEVPRSPPARGHLPPAVPQGFHVPRRPGHRPVPARPGRHALVRLALFASPARQQTRLRHNEPPASQPRDRHRRGLRGAGRGPARTRPGPNPRHRTQPHGRHRQRQPVVERRAGERPRVALCRLLRHRLAVVAAAGAARPPPGARSSATPTARCSKPGSSAWSSSPAPSRSTISTMFSPFPHALTR